MKLSMDKRKLWKVKWALSLALVSTMIVRTHVMGAPLWVVALLGVETVFVYGLTYRMWTKHFKTLDTIEESLEELRNMVLEDDDESRPV